MRKIGENWQKLAFFGANFGVNWQKLAKNWQTFCLCKKNDKYGVCAGLKGSLTLDNVNTLYSVHFARRGVDTNARCLKSEVNGRLEGRELLRIGNKQRENTLEQKMML